MNAPIRLLTTVLLASMLLVSAGCSKGTSGDSSGGSAPSGSSANASGTNSGGSQNSGGNTGASSTAAPKPPTPQDSGFGFAYGQYSLRVPGVAYQTTDAATNQNKQVVSSGAQTASTITINSDGTYVWNSVWDGKVIKGNWQKTGAKDYPIIVPKGQEGKDWKLGKQDGSGKGDIILWDGNSMHYVGDLAK